MSLQVWLPLNKDLHNQGLSGDLVFSKSSTATLNSNGYYDFSGYTGNGIYMNNSTCVNFMNTYIDNHSFSLSCWFKCTNTKATGLICVGYGIRLCGGANTVYYQGRQGESVMCNANMPTNDNKWHHIATTYDISTGNINFYIDGILKDTKNFPDYTHTWHNGIFVGRDPNVATEDDMWYLQGSLYDIRIYDHALSLKEVKELAKGLYLHYTFDDAYIENTVNIIKKGATLGWNWSYQKVTEYPEGINSSSVVYKRTNADAYIGTASDFLNDCDTPTLYNGKYLTLSCWYYRVSSNSPKMSFSVLGDNGSSQYTGISNRVSASNLDITGEWTYATIVIQLLSNLSGYSKITYLHSGGGLNDDLYIADIQIELKDHATPYTPNSRTTTIIPDNSGFGNDGTINGNLQVLSGSARGSYCTKFGGTSSDYIFNNLNNPNLKSASFWCYIGDSNPTNQIVFMHRESKMSFGFYETNKVILANNAGGGVNCYYDISSTKKNAWNHFVVVFTDSSYNLYLNGIKLLNPAGQNWGNNANGLYIANRSPQSGYTAYPFNGQISDFRMYTTILSESDIQNLYKDSFIIDDTQKSYCYELNESDSTSQVKLTETGIAKCKNFSDSITSTFDDTEYIEPDGSVWIKIFHHNAPSTNGLFASTDSFTTNVYKDENKWFNVSVCNKVSKWELMVKQKTTSNSVEMKGRWIQNANPMTATSADTHTSAITINTSEGYSNFSSSIGGIRAVAGGYAYIIQTTDSGQGWWGGIGEYQFYNSGIERFALSGSSGQVTTGYLDLYLRIDNLEETTDTKIAENGSLTSNELIEL